MEKVKEMDVKNEFSDFKPSREERKKIKENQIHQERSKLLVFRDVGMDLDKPILSRDVFLILKYFRFGREFAIDNELERLLRYFNEHAINELKIIDKSKLMRGTEALLRLPTSNYQKFPCAASAASSPTFPTVQCANVAQFCPAPTNTAINHISNCYSDKSVVNKFLKRGDAPPEKYSRKSSSLFIELSRKSFRRPAVVIFSQLGQKFGGDADTQWRRLAYRTINPFFLEEGKSSSVVSSQLPIDVISLRSADMSNFQWVQKLYISRFIATLANNDSISGLNLAMTTFVGTQLLQPFFESVGLRNYLSPYVFLVDRDGNIRWMSGGFPDAWEERLFPTLLGELAKQ